MSTSAIARFVLRLGFAYDVFLGAVILIFPSWVYNFFGITPANHLGYVQLIALFVIVLGIMQGIASRAPETAKDLLFCALLLKLSYCSVVFGHRLFGTIPGLWVLFAWIDLLFALLFAAFLLSLPPKKTVPA